MKKAFFPGSFDPPTNGHLNLIKRAAAVFDTLYVVIAQNREKKGYLTIEKRLELMNELLADYNNVKLVSWDRLVVDFAKDYETPLMVRGVRALTDFSYEFELAMMNKSLMPELEVVFFPTDPQYFVLRSSSIRELVSFGGDISTMVPKNVEEELRKKN